jgi:F-type H+-transporting ATPase subunit b
MRIDWWTLALQTFNVLVLVWILTRFFFRPVANMVARRREEANMLLSDAAEARREAVDARADVEKMRAGVAEERDQLIMDAQQAARTEKDKLVTQASQEIAKLRSEAEATMVHEKTAMEQEIIAHASELAVGIAQRLLGRLQSGASDALFLDALGRELHALSPEEKVSLTSAAGEHPFELVTAVPLSNMEMQKIRGALKEALGSELRFEVRHDRELIAGLELHGPSVIVRNSWRADLDRIREELARVKQLSGS